MTGLPEPPRLSRDWTPWVAGAGLVMAIAAWVYSAGFQGAKLEAAQAEVARLRGLTETVPAAVARVEGRMDGQEITLADLRERIGLIERLHIRGEEP